MDFMEWDICSLFSPKDLILEIWMLFMMVMRLFWILKHIDQAQLLCNFNGRTQQCYSSVISPEDKDSTGYYYMFGALFWLSSLAWDTVKITQGLKAGFICLFMAIDLTYLETTLVVAQA